MKKIVFLDIDGTLVDYEGQLPESAVTAIHQTQQRGNLVYPVTGRSKAEMYQDLWQIGFDGFIGGNGSYIEIGEEIFKQATLSLTETTQIIDWLQERGLEFYLEANSGLYASPAFEIRGRSTIQQYSAKKGTTDPAKMTVRSVFPEMIFDGDLKRPDVNKISFILDNYDDFLAALATFPQFKLGTWGGVGETALFGDIALAGIDKGTAIGELLPALGIEQSQTIAFGDAKVDIPMLNYCAIGVAMANGGPEIKAIADYITAAVDDDGLAKAFIHYGLTS